MHTVSLGISIYLALMFRRIANMPPDMNPLESNLTSRVARHKRNKSSVTSSYTSSSENVKRLSTPLEEHRRSGAPYETLSRPPSIPFMHTRAGSKDSLVSSKRDSRVDLPSRQYQITPGNSPRNSVADQKRMSNPRLAQRGSYMEVPLHETGSPSSSRPNSAAVNVQPINASPTRVAKFTEAWYASESLINRTQQRQRAMNSTERATAERTKAYEALSQRYGDDDDSDSDQENAMRLGEGSDLEDDDDGPINVSGNIHPNPLRLNPLLPTPPRQQQKTPIKVRESQVPKPVLTEMSMNRRSVSGSQDIADAKSGFGSGAAAAAAAATTTPGPARRPTILGTWGRVRGNRNSSIQPEGDFYSKPYGELRSGTPPVMYGGEEKRERESNQARRQVSSGNDYDLGSTANLGYRRKVSGRAAEEGMAGPAAAGARYSRYSVLNE